MSTSICRATFDPRPPTLCECVGSLSCCHTSSRATSIRPTTLTRTGPIRSTCRSPVNLSRYSSARRLRIPTGPTSCQKIPRWGSWPPEIIPAFMVSIPSLSRWDWWMRRAKAPFPRRGNSASPTSPMAYPTPSTSRNRRASRTSGKAATKSARRRLRW